MRINTIFCVNSVKSFLLMIIFFLYFINYVVLVIRRCTNIITILTMFRCVCDSGFVWLFGIIVWLLKIMIFRCRCLCCRNVVKIFIIRKC